MFCYTHGSAYWGYPVPVISTYIGCGGKVVAGNIFVHSSPARGNTYRSDIQNYAYHLETLSLMLSLLGTSELASPGERSVFSL